MVTCLEGSPLPCKPAAQARGSYVESRKALRVTSTIGERPVVAGRRPAVERQRPDQPVVADLLDDVGRPTAHSRHDEDRREHLHRQPECVINAGGRPVEVGLQALG